MQRTNALIGIKIFEVTKSRKSKIVLPNNLISPKALKESVAGIARAEIIIKSKMHDFNLVNLNLSLKVATETSRMLMPEVKAAQKSNIKNKSATIFPCGI